MINHLDYSGPSPCAVVRLRFDGHSTAVHMQSRDIASRSRADLFIYLGRSAAARRSSNSRSAVELQSNGASSQSRIVVVSRSTALPGRQRLAGHVAGRTRRRSAPRTSDDRSRS